MLPSDFVSPPGHLATKIVIANIGRTAEKSSLRESRAKITIPYEAGFWNLSLEKIENRQSSSKSFGCWLKWFLILFRTQVDEKNHLIKNRAP